MNLIPFVYAPMALKGELIKRYPDEWHPIPRPDDCWGKIEPTQNGRYGQTTDANGNLGSVGRFLYKLHDVVVVPDVFEKGVYHIALEKGVLALEARTGKYNASNGGFHMGLRMPGHSEVDVALMGDYEIARHETEPHTYYLCGWNGNYAHRILDTLPRGWAEDEGLIPPGTKWAPQADVAIRYDTLYFPSFWPAAGYAPGPVGWLKKRLGKYPAMMGNVCYFSRQDAKTRRVKNEHKIIQMLDEMRLPYRIAEGSKLPLDEQIMHAAMSRIIIGPHGAAMVNAIFANAASVIEFVPESYQHPIFQYTSKWAGNRYYRMVCPDGENQDMTVNLDGLRYLLEQACQTT